MARHRRRDIPLRQRGHSLRSGAISPEPPALRLHLSLSTRYRELIEDLARSLNAPDVKREAAEALRALISEVRMVPDPTARNGHTIENIGKLAGILRLGGLDATKPPAFCEGCVGNDGCGSSHWSLFHFNREGECQTPLTPSPMRSAGSPNHDIHRRCSEISAACAKGFPKAAIQQAAPQCSRTACAKSS